MNTLVLESPANLIATETEEPSHPPKGYAKVRVRRIGVCGTDIHAFAGKQPFFSYPRILGHELGVEVVEVEENDRIKPGMRCAVEPYLNCGHCIACRNGKPNCCTSLQVLGVHTDGGHREFIHVPIGKLHPSDKLSFDQLALVETLGIGAHAVDRAQLQPGETVCVIGAGPIGLSVIQFAKAAGTRVIVADTNETRLRFCQDKLGLAQTIDVSKESIEERLKMLTNNDMPTAMFDATGHLQSMASTFQLAAHSGRIVFVGLCQGDISFADPNFHRRELALLASRNARPQDFTNIIGLIEKGEIDTTPWITHRASLADTPSVFADWCKPETGVLKAMIEL